MEGGIDWKEKSDRIIIGKCPKRTDWKKEKNKGYNITILILTISTVSLDKFLNLLKERKFMDKSGIKKTLRRILGVICIILGVIGLFLPFLQGILLIFAGLVLLEFEPIDRWMLSVKQKWKERKKR